MVEPSVKSSEHGGGGVDLPPGFRFHPTDEEVITSYLLQKFLNPSFAPHAIGEVDLNKCEPWDLPSKAKMGEEDSKEWYFFCRKGMKYPTGTRANRATKEGYWKATGKDREIFFKPPAGQHDDVGREQLVVGMKKTLVFYTGRAPRGTKTNWVMHEFRLIDGKYPRHRTTNDDLLLRFNPKDEWVVCKVHHKGGQHDASAAKKAAAGGGGGEEQHYSSAAGTPNVSSVETGGGGGGDNDDEFLVDSMLLDYYSSSSHFNTSGPTPPIATATAAAAPPHNADYCCSCYPVHTTTCTTSSSSRSRSYYYSLHHQQEMVAAKALAASSSSSAAGLPSASVAAGAGPAQRSSQQQQRLLPAGNYNYCDDGGNYYAAGYRTSQYY